MANKNQKLIRNLIHKAFKTKQAELAIEVPRQGYHSDPKFNVRRIPIIASVFKAKARPFPKFEGLSLMEQRSLLGY